MYQLSITLFPFPQHPPASIIKSLCMWNEEFITTVGGRHIAREDCQLPFSHLEVWTRVRIQQRSYHHPHDVLPPQTVNVSPQLVAWPHGCYDAVLINTNRAMAWPHSGMSGMFEPIIVFLRCQAHSNLRAHCCATLTHYAHCFPKSPAPNYG
jgi:hypothetical protein